jgi:hypothetical protein
MSDVEGLWEAADIELGCGPATPSRDGREAAGNDGSGLIASAVCTEN